MHKHYNGFPIHKERMDKQRRREPLGLDFHTTSLVEQILGNLLQGPFSCSTICHTSNQKNPPRSNGIRPTTHSMAHTFGENCIVLLFWGNISSTTTFWVLPRGKTISHQPLSAERNVLLTGIMLGFQERVFHSWKPLHSSLSVSYFNVIC